MTTYTANDDSPAVLGPIAEDSGALLITAADLVAETSPVDQGLLERDSLPTLVTADDPASVELGVRFTASVDGSISGIRFYKGLENGGEHVAHLWDSNGNLIASATFANESSDGWQEVTFDVPIAIDAGTTYVASYHTSGHYSATANYFNGSQSVGHLSTQSSAGVYAYGSGAVFPTDSYNATNYLVDVVFNAPLSITELTLESGNGTLVDHHDGTWTYTPAQDDDSAASFSYTASDGLHQVIATAQLDITGINDAPVLSGTAAVLAAGTEDVAYTVHASDLLAGFTDVDGGTLSVSGLTADHGTLTDNGDGTWSFAPAANYNGPINLSYTVVDGLGGSTPASQGFSLTAVNDAPVLSGTAAVLAAGTEDVAYTVHASDLLAGFTDVDGGTLSVSGLTADHGTLTDNGDGTWSFAPAANYNGPINLSYTVIDGLGGSTPASQGFSLTAVNDAPVLSGTAAVLTAGTEDVAYTVHASDLLAGFTDVDGGTLSVSDLTADHGTLTDNGDGTWSFAPAANYNGPINLSYTVIDGLGGSTPASQGFSLTAVNDAPVLSGTAAVLAAGTEDVAYTVHASDLLAGFTDVDGGTLSVSGLTADHGTLTDNGDGTWSFAPAANYNGPINLSYTVVDGLGGSTPASQGFSLTAVNDAPVLSGTAAVLAAGTEDVAYTVHASDLLAGFTDVDGGTLSVSGLTADHGTLTDNGDGTWSFAPAANYNGPINLSYTVIDGLGGSTPASQGFSLTAVNDAPVLSGTAAVLAAGTEDVAYTVHASDLLAGFTDVDGGTLSVSGLTADHGTLTDNGDGTWSFAPAANYNGPINLSYTVIDGLGGSTPASQGFSLTAVNDAPVLSGTAAVLAAGTEDVAYTVHASDLLAGFTDVDGGTLSVSGLTADHGTLTDNGDGTWSFAPAANYNGPINLSYTVIDGLGGSTPASQGFSLTAVNDAPVLSGTAAVLAAGTEDVAYTVHASDLLAGFTDVDGGTLSVSGLTADHGTLTDNGDGTWSFAPAANYNGPINLSYTVIDGLGGSTPASQGFSLTAVNDAPVLSGTAAVLAAGTEDVAYTVHASDLLAGFTDVDGGTLSVSGLTADHGTLTDNGDGTWSFAPAANYNGPINLSYTVIDGLGGSTPASQGFSLTAVNDAPVLSGTAAVLAAGTEDVAYTVHASDLLAGFTDVDGGTLSVSGLTADHGTLTDNGDGTWSFAPAANYNGPINLSYTVIDGLGGSTPASQGFSLTAVNDAPVAVDDTAEVFEYQTVVGNVLTIPGADHDIDGGTLTVSGVSGASGLGGVWTVAGQFGTLTVHADGQYSYFADNAETLAAGQNRPDVFTYSVSDGNGGTDTATLSITVKGTNTGTSGDNLLQGTDADETFSGGGGNDFIDARGGNDTLNGGTGADNMRGGAGNDVYLVDNASDIVNESISGSTGLDTVQSSISFNLANTARVLGSVENLILLGASNINGTGNSLNNVLTGNAGANALSGAAGNDTLNGGAGNDTLNGGTGADNMRGGAGNDVYLVDNASDIVNESISGSTGLDTVQSSISFNLANTARVLGSVENLTLLGAGNINCTGNSLNNVLTGNAGANVLNGAAGNDTLNGGAGNDTLNGGTGADNMRGGAGNDVYLVDNASDIVNESISGSTGLDTVQSSISFNLANTARVLGSVENLTLLGSDNINGTGNAFSNMITGNAGANVLNGAAGNDTINGGSGNDVLYGGVGSDRLTGGAGYDSFVFNTKIDATSNVDTITDFNVIQDTIRLDNAVMAALGSAMSSGEFWKSTSGLAHDKDDHIIYETDTGKLFYDSNGSAAGGSTHIATLSANLALTYADFLVI